MSKKDSLRFKVCISSGDPEFYEHLKQFGPYYRSRRLLELARFGYSIQKGSAVLATRLAPTEIAPRILDEPNPSQQLHYKFSESAASQVADMLDSLNSWGDVGGAA